MVAEDPEIAHARNSLKAARASSSACWRASGCSSVSYRDASPNHMKDSPSLLVRQSTSPRDPSRSMTLKVKDSLNTGVTIVSPGNKGDDLGLPRRHH